ncbi:MAG TPA: ATP-binding protein, partial [Dokdonella sp.]
MSTYAEWERANSRFLADQLAALRARLQRLARSDAGEAHSESASVAVSSPAPPVHWFGRLFKRDAQTSVERAITPPLVAPAAPATAVAATAGDASADAALPQPALTLLAQRLGLSDFERDVLLLCAAMELDTRIALLCAQAQHDASKPYPTFALAMALFEQPAWDAMSPERPLRYWRLVDVSSSAAQPLVGSLLRADERIVSYLKGANYLDERIAPLVVALAEPVFELPPSQQSLADAIVDRLQSAEVGSAPIVQLLGSDAASKQLVAARVAERLGLRAHRVAAEAIPATLAEQETLLRLWQRECALLPLALYIDALETDRVGPAGVALQRALARFGGLAFLDTREPWPLDRATLPVDIAKPTPAEQRALWNEALGTDRASAADRPAVHFDFGANAIRAAAGAALALVQGDAQKLPALLWTQCIAGARPVLDQLAQPVEAKARWDDLELPPAEKALLRQIADQVEHRGTVYDDWGFRARMNRGLGISVLFAGESGTGKTMAAEVIANELGLLLYRIDLSAVVNKYIGETEKNLRRLF